MAIDSLNFNNYTWLPSLMTAGNVQDAIPTAPVATDEVPRISFSDFLSDAVGNTIASDAESSAAGMDLLLGGEQDLHSVLIAGQKAEVLLNLTVQIRNKMVESYQEIMRMQV
ncbi:MAG: flagellar hook-basal body complex protein FliE [Oscillospiraceae bacterium]|jgi:flagellar hook-basal body complex protein FliE|nr:flagellar hook-basal body complex protein FliE [Oscillospiraceae bacterium]